MNQKKLFCSELGDAALEASFAKGCTLLLCLGGFRVDIA
jgi:hypothetical protein